MSNKPVKKKPVKQAKPSKAKTDKANKKPVKIDTEETETTTLLNPMDDPSLSPEERFMMQSYFTLESLGRNTGFIAEAINVLANTINVHAQQSGTSNSTSELVTYVQNLAVHVNKLHQGMASMANQLNQVTQHVNVVLQERSTQNQFQPPNFNGGVQTYVS